MDLPESSLAHPSRVGLGGKLGTLQLPACVKLHTSLCFISVVAVLAWESGYLSLN